LYSETIPYQVPEEKTETMVMMVPLENQVPLAIPSREQRGILENREKLAIKVFQESLELMV